MFRNRYRPGPAGLAWLTLVAIVAPAGAVTHEEIEAQIRDGRLLAARDAAQALTSQNPSDCRAWQLLGEAETHLTHMTLAIDAYRKGLEACPEDKDLLKALGRTYDEIEQYEDAVRVLSKLWALDTSDASVGSRLGADCYRAGRCAEGRKAYEALLVANPDRHGDRLAYAQLLSRICHDFTAAEEQYRMLLAKTPGDPQAHCGLAYMLAESGRVDDAVKAAEAGLAAVAENKGCLYAAWGRALEAGGDSLMAKGQVTEALTLYEKAIDPLQQGTGDPIFGDYCKSILTGVRYKESPMEELKP